MKKNEVIEKIIKLQTEKSNLFNKVAKREDLEQLKLYELNFIYNVSKNLN